MSHRYALRFESGERLGETVPINVTDAGATFSIGRKPGNSLQVVENSVSGRHAELEVGPNVLTVRDLDSTNGTRVRGERIRTSALGHGDELALGNVLFAVIDTEEEVALEDPPLSGGTFAKGDLPAPAGGDLAQTKVQPREERLEITADDLRRSRKTSKLAPIVLGVLAVGGGAAYWWTSNQSEDGGGRRTSGRPVTEPAGNLIGGYSFEGEAGWASDEALAGATTTFESTRSARASGSQGLRAELAGGDVAGHASDAVRVKPGAGVEAQASFRTRGQAEARLGLRFERSGSAADGTAVSPLTVWSSPIVSEEHEIFAFAATVPGGYDRARVLLKGASTEAASPTDAEDDMDYADVDVDDVALLSVEGAAPLRVGEWSALAVGSPTRALTLAKVDRVLVSSATVREEGRGHQLNLEIADGDGGLTLTPAAAGLLTLVVEPSVAAGGLATLGDGGYSGHGAAFERDAVTDVLLGEGSDLVRVVLAQPSAVRGHATGDACRIEIPVRAGDRLQLQLRFEEERVEALTIGRRARRALADGRPGEALAAWNELLSRYPFDGDLVREAAAVRATAIQEGLQRVRGLEGELERARFFRLVDLYDEVGSRVDALAETYTGNEVATRARDLAARIATERRELAADLDQYERQRLEAIARQLDALGAPRLSREVRAYQAEHFIEGQDR